MEIIGKGKEATPVIENELRISSEGVIENRILYALSLLQEMGYKEIVLKAAGRAISKAVMIAEHIKRRINVGLHQNTTIESIDNTNTLYPFQDDPLPIKITHRVPAIKITLSKQELDTSSVGYQPPIPVESRNGYREGGHRYGGQGPGRGRGYSFCGRGRGSINGGSIHQGFRYNIGHSVYRPSSSQGPEKKIEELDKGKGTKILPYFIKKEQEVIEISSSSSSSSSEEPGSPLRSILCVKSGTDLKHLEETEDCFILDYDPFEYVDSSKFPTNHGDDDANSDISVLAEKGQVACRDYPHSRHLCVKFPFDTTPHQSYCNLCYCYVCDSEAPCEYWTGPVLAHCNASENNLFWRCERTSVKQGSDT